MGVMSCSGGVAISTGPCWVSCIRDHGTLVDGRCREIVNVLPIVDSWIAGTLDFSWGFCRQADSLHVQPEDIWFLSPEAPPADFVLFITASLVASSETCHHHATMLKMSCFFGCPGDDGGDPTLLDGVYSGQMHS
ncbi:hypothetical protein GOP47_0026458 [Adiantum capillus-veneris]|nr:hypothetical protein GOP47_0026458 [Adiantum capillus-veneris]